MKKFLSLVLALVMTMSLVTISAGAKDFADDSKITYKEAVDVMSTLGVVGGYTDGSFNPQGTLTRGAAAKIICNLILGTTTASALVADAAPYKDVPTNHTFAGYIAYCQKEGIVDGYADGIKAEGNYFFVTEYAKNGNLSKNAKVEASVYTLEGKDDTVTLNKINSTKVSEMDDDHKTNSSFNEWVSFRLKEDGKYDITTKTTVGGVFGGDGQAKAIENGKGGMALSNGDSIRVTNATIFVVNGSSDNVKVYTGIKNIPTIDAAANTAIYAMKDGNYAKFVFVDLNDGHTKGGGSSDVLYILKNAREDNYSQDVDDNTDYTYKAILNGTETKVEVSAVTEDTAQGLYTDVVYSSNNYIDDVEKLSYNNTHKIRGVEGAYMDDFQVETINDTLERKGDVLTTADNSVSFYLADGAQAIVIKANGDIDTITSARSLASSYKTTALSATVYAVLNADGEATTLYVQK